MDNSQGEEVKGVFWQVELEDDSLAEAQRELENNFGADFESQDYESKGFAKSNSLPFYTDVDDSLELMGTEVELSRERWRH